MRLLTRLLLLTLVAFGGALLVAAPSGAATKKKKTTTTSSLYPVIERVTPRKLNVGQRLTIYGRGFRPGPLKSTVVFYRSGKPVVFIKAEKATSRKLTVTVSVKVLSLFKDSPNTARLIRLRVIGKKMSKRWTQNSRSVRINPQVKGEPGSGTAPNPVAPSPELTCQQQAAAAPTADKDGDYVDNRTELLWGMDPCNGDTDGDGVSDGFEFWSSWDINRTQPYPGKQPAPNAIDPTDANFDFDGDGLTLIQEYKLWAASPAAAQFPKMSYSDGLQQSVVEPYVNYLDLDGDGVLTDDERDFDKDYLSNVVEFNMAGTQTWWNTVKWPKPRAGAEAITEKPYSLRPFKDVDATLFDSDADGIGDGEDDQDMDGFNNFDEMQVGRDAGGFRYHAFNPCLPNLRSLTCARYKPLQGGGFPPFDGSDTIPPTVIWYWPGGDTGIDHTNVEADADKVCVRWPWNRADQPVDNKYPQCGVNTTWIGGLTGQPPGS